MSSKNYPVRAQRVEVISLSDENIESQAQRIAMGGERALYETRGAIRAMLGGNIMFLGSAAIERPGEFYLDDRCGQFPYPDAAILQAVRILKRAYEIMGVTDPEPLRLPNLGVL